MTTAEKKDRNGKKKSGWLETPLSKLILLTLTAGVAAAFILLPLSGNSNSDQLALGDVASTDILAPGNLTFTSHVLTDEAREIAAQSVSPRYTEADPNIAREQLNHMRDVLDYISTVRIDAFSTPEQKLADLAQLQSVQLQPESMDLLVSLSDNEWQSIRLEANRILEQTMRADIREDEVEATRRSISNQVSLALQSEQQDLVVDLVSSFVIPNSNYSEERTSQAQQDAIDAVEPVILSYKTGETIVERGHIITPENVEALEQFGLMEAETTWEDYASVIALVAINFAFIGLYFVQRPDLRANFTSLALMAILFLIFLYGGRVLIPGRTVTPYLYPVAGFGMVVAALISSRAAIILAVPLSILTAFGLPNSFELTLFYLFSSAIGILLLRNVYRLLTIFWAGLGVAVAGMLVILTFRLTDPALDTLGLLQLIGGSGFNGLASASLTIVLQFLLAQLLGLTTTLQLLEISRPDHPLLQKILRTAPGTYQHSLQIANLAEQAAESIGANTLLTRVGALYHDAGKINYPQYFIENKIPGVLNPHDLLPPAESARIIIQHVNDGVELVKKHRLPKRIQDFVWEHHGKMLTRYQFAKAVEAADGNAMEVDRTLYTYPGPKPRSRETGLLMLADGVEARARAERPEDEEAVRALVEDVIQNRLADGQLNDTSLTLNDIETITDSFTTTLRGVYHPRIKYPVMDNQTIKSESLQDGELTVKRPKEIE